ncbi:hypothetical protein Pan181_14160 [Aeoliella mucimassa]|uniref:Uncharacterized protein n=1 Tax=Aeoliella mucimassa TaxID=2527972 RepID=A0A518AKH4_9BACT|nr:hypothetical protein Pan181_14160 [Aeoliella mucimassa]
MVGTRPPVARAQAEAALDRSSIARPLRSGYRNQGREAKLFANRISGAAPGKRQASRASSQLDRPRVVERLLPERAMPLTRRWQPRQFPAARPRLRCPRAKAGSLPRQTPGAEGPPAGRAAILSSASNASDAAERLGRRAKPRRAAPAKTPAANGSQYCLQFCSGSSTEVPIKRLPYRPKLASQRHQRETRQRNSVIAYRAISTQTSGTPQRVKIVLNRMLPNTWKSATQDSGRPRLAPNHSRS